MKITEFTILLISAIVSAIAIAIYHVILLPWLAANQLAKAFGGDDE